MRALRAGLEARRARRQRAAERSTFDEKAGIGEKEPIVEEAETSKNGLEKESTEAERNINGAGSEYQYQDATAERTGGVATTAAGRARRDEKSEHKDSKAGLREFALEILKDHARMK